MASLKWGIVSAGRISHDFVTALSTLPCGEHEVVAIGARDLKSAQAFAETHGIRNAYGNYKDIAQDANVEIVYIGSLNPAHLNAVTLMLEHGKHVLCEKPLTMNYKETKSLIDLAKSKNLFLMEGIWSRFFPAYQHLKKQIQSGALGDIREVNVDFGYDHKGNDRVTKKSFGAGVTLDQGVYLLQAAMWAFGEAPIAVNVTGTLNEEGVDMAMKGELRFRNGGVAKIAADSTRTLRNQFIVKGTKGEIVVHQFWSPTKITDVDGSDKTWPVPVAKLAFNYPNSAGLSYEAEAVREAIRAGAIEIETVSHDESLTIAGVQDEIRRQLGVHYPGHDD